MRRPTIRLTALALALISASAFGAPTESRTFEKEKTEAQANLATPDGAAYDEELGRYLMSIVGVKDAMHECAERVEPPREVYGFFRFDEKGQYRLIMRPEGVLSKCLAQLFEGRDPPKPPRLPYVNDFNFTENE